MRIFSPIVSDFYYPEDGLLDFWFDQLSPRKSEKELEQGAGPGDELKEEAEMFVSLSEIGLSRSHSFFTFTQTLKLDG